MAKKGRPPKVNIEDLINDVDEYIQSANPPIVAEYAIMHGITRQYLYELAKKEEGEGDSRLSDTIKKIVDSKAIMLERNGLLGKYQPTMAIFSLKQLGWKDKPDIEDDTDMVKQFLEAIKYGK
jgi:hypothetical protein